MIKPKDVFKSIRRYENDVYGVITDWLDAHSLKKTPIVMGYAPISEDAITTVPRTSAGYYPKTGNIYIPFQYVEKHIKIRKEYGHEFTLDDVVKIFLGEEYTHSIQFRLSPSICDLMQKQWNILRLKPEVPKTKFYHALNSHGILEAVGDLGVEKIEDAFNIDDPFLRDREKYEEFLRTNIANWQIALEFGKDKNAISDYLQSLTKYIALKKSEEMREWSVDTMRKFVREWVPTKITPKEKKELRMYLEKIDTTKTQQLDNLTNVMGRMFF